MGREALSYERNVRRIIRDNLKRLPRAKFVPYPGSPHAERGTPDIVGCIDGRAVLIEVKRPRGGRLSRIQIHRIAEWEDAGALVVVAQSWKDVAEALDAAGLSS